MDERTNHRTFRPHKINVIWYHTRNNTDQRTFGCNSPHHYNVLRAMRGNIYTIASTNCLRGRTSDMDFDKNQDSGNTTHTPQTHTRRVDPTPDFPPLASPKQAAIIWIMAHLEAYRLQTQRGLSLTEYMEFLQRARWKENHWTPKKPTVGRYLDVLYFLQPHQHKIRLKQD